MNTVFSDRHHAGKMLAAALSAYRGRGDVAVLALPRGGVPVAYEVASALRAPLDVFVIRKLGYPGHEEFAMGAIATGGVCVLNPDLTDQLEPDNPIVRQAIERERRELERRERLYRQGRGAAELRDRCLLVIDDGLATGSSMRAAIVALRKHAPKRIVVAVPVAAPETCAEIGEEVDEIVCAITPKAFSSVGHWYHDFTQVGDAEVQALLARAGRRAAPDGASSTRGGVSHG